MCQIELRWSHLDNDLVRVWDGAQTILEHRFGEWRINLASNFKCLSLIGEVVGEEGRKLQLYGESHVYTLL